MWDGHAKQSPEFLSSYRNGSLLLPPTWFCVFERIEACFWFFDTYTMEHDTPSIWFSTLCLIWLSIMDNFAPPLHEVGSRQLFDGIVGVILVVMCYEGVFGMKFIQDFNSFKWSPILCCYSRFSPCNYLLSIQIYADLCKYKCVDMGL